MKKLLELKSLDTEVRELLQTVKLPVGIFICAHLHYMHPKVSIYFANTEPFTPTTQIMQSSVLFEYDIDIDEEIVEDIISQVEKVMQ